MATVSDAPSGQAAEREYRCGVCRSVLLYSSSAQGIIRAVWCPKCRRRMTVYLGGRQTRADLVRDEDCPG